MENIWKHKRLADESIYLNEDRYCKPKEVHKRIVAVLSEYIDKNYSSILDCGTATGELLYLIYQTFPDMKLSGFDYSSKMIDQAKKKVKEAHFFVQDLTSDYSGWQIKPKSDIVICSGVLCIFDDYEMILDNILNCTNKKGLIIIRTIFNPDPIDVVMRYRKSGSNTWEGGWNILSKLTIENYLYSKFQIDSLIWGDYNLDINIEKNKSDPMRAHTKAINGEKTLVNGACQILNQTNLIVKLK